MLNRLIYYHYLHYAKRYVVYLIQGFLLLYAEELFLYHENHFRNPIKNVLFKKELRLENRFNLHVRKGDILFDHHPVTQHIFSSTLD